MVMNMAESERNVKRAGTLADFLARSPLRGAAVDLERVKHGPRHLDLEWTAGHTPVAADADAERAGTEHG
jgi:hypothetical protein